MDLLDSPAFTTHINELLDKWHVPGLSIAIVQDNDISSKGYGKCSIDPHKPCTAETLFDLGSSSKSLTAASVGLLCADNDKYPDIHWDAKMSKLLPDDFVMSEPSYTKDVTVADILSHRTGLPRHDSSYLGIHATKPDTAHSVTRNLRNLEISAPIRSKWQYNNMMYTVATYLVEQTSGLSFADYLSKHFFQPLDMKDTYLQPNTVVEAGKKDQMAIPYTWDEDTTSYKVTEYQQCPEAQGAGSIFSSANDYIKYVRAMINCEDPITEDIRKEIMRPRSISDADDDDLAPFTSNSLYAAGWAVMYYRGHKVVEHDGSVAGFGSSHFFLPQLKFGGVVLGNAGGAPDVCEIVMRELIDEAIGLPKEERLDWFEIQSKTYNKYKEESKKENANLLYELCPDAEGVPQPQTTPLESYIGMYWNPGYHGLPVKIKDDKLFVDAADRSMGFSLTFEHICEQTKYIAHLCDYFEGGDEPLKAEFRFENDKVVKLGVKFEFELEDMIWFDRIENDIYSKIREEL